MVTTPSHFAFIFLWSDFEQWSHKVYCLASNSCSWLCRVSLYITVEVSDEEIEITFLQQLFNPQNWLTSKCNSIWTVYMAISSFFIMWNRTPIAWRAWAQMLNFGEVRRWLIGNQGFIIKLKSLERGQKENHRRLSLENAILQEVNMASLLFSRKKTSGSGGIFSCRVEIWFLRLIVRPIKDWSITAQE